MTKELTLWRWHRASRKNRTGDYQMIKELTLLTAEDLTLISVDKLDVEIIQVADRAARYLRVNKRGPGRIGPKNPLWYVATLTGFSIVSVDENEALEKQYQHRKLLEDLNYDSKQ